MKRPDIKMVPLEMHVDDRGNLIEMVRVLKADGDHALVHKFGQVYMAFTEQAGIVRALHKHEHMWDWYCVPVGSAKVLVYWQSNEDVDYLPIGHPIPPFHIKWEREEYILTARKPSVLQVPPYTFHGWCALEPKTMLLVVASDAYRAENPDEERLPYDHFDPNDWEVINR